MAIVVIKANDVFKQQASCCFGYWDQANYYLNLNKKNEV